MKPKVSICIPTYNRHESLGQTIEYLLRQTFSDWEMIVCDDASTDSTEEIVRSFADSRIRYIRNLSNLGLYGNWNSSIQLAQGDYVTIYHDHDIYLPTILERSVDLLDRYPRASFVHTAILLIDHENQPVGLDIRSIPEILGGSKMARLLARGWSSPVMAATAMVRRKAYQEVGYYNYEKYGICCDLDMWFRLSQIGDVAYVSDPQALIRTRRKGDTTSQFKWSDVVGMVKMKQDQLQKCFPSGLNAVINKLIFSTKRDYRLMQLYSRALLLESRTVIKEGEQVLRTFGGMPALLFALPLVKNPVMQKTFRYFFLPQHYKNTKFFADKQRLVATNYLMQHENLHGNLTRFP